MRRNELRQRRFRSELQSGENENEEGGSSSHSRMKCRSCKEEYRCDGEEAGTCRKCFEKAGETEDELKSKVDFLRLLPTITLTGIPNAFSEVVLVASGEDSPLIRANWAVLISRSLVFRKMLENKMEESISGRIRIRDVSYDVLSAFVNYLYTADACLDEDMAHNLLVLADRYLVEHLKTCCEKYLISIESAWCEKWLKEKL